MTKAKWTTKRRNELIKYSESEGYKLGYEQGKKDAVKERQNWKADLCSDSDRCEIVKQKQIEVLEKVKKFADKIDAVEEGSCDCPDFEGEEVEYTTELCDFHNLKYFVKKELKRLRK